MLANLYYIMLQAGFGYSFLSKPRQFTNNICKISNNKKPFYKKPAFYYIKEIAVNENTCI